jgi:hypothetical protein
MIAKWSIERRGDHIDVRAHGTLEASLKPAGLPDYHKVHTNQSGGMRALPSIPVQPGTELIVKLDGVRVVVTVEDASGGAA